MDVYITSIVYRNSNSDVYYRENKWQLKLNIKDEELSNVR